MPENEQKNIGERNLKRKEVRQIGGLVFASQEMEQVIEKIIAVAHQNVNVLIRGETGAGKELVARLIHILGRRNEQMAIINISGLSESLIESELFGHKKGSFTNATESREGHLGALGGTIFLDEIGDLSLLVQLKLLRPIENREYYPVGSLEIKPVRARILSATNQNLEKKIRLGKFRRDLYFRLATFEIHVPPLRHRVDDILPLAEHFIRHSGYQPEGQNVVISDEAAKILLEYDWPGNVRELQRMIITLLISKNGSQEKKIESSDILSLMVRNEVSDEDGSLPFKVAQFEKKLVLEALDRCRWSMRATANRLGINMRSLRYLIGKYEIKAGK